MRLIDKDRLLKAIDKYDKECEDILIEMSAYSIYSIIKDCPIVDQWHYPSRGEYPIEGEEILCKLPCNHYAVGKYNTQFEYFGFENINYTPINIECWQYIIPPKEET